jgi:hypothetical protein
LRHTRRLSCCVQARGQPIFADKQRGQLSSVLVHTTVDTNARKKKPRGHWHVCRVVCESRCMCAHPLASKCGQPRNHPTCCGRSTEVCRACLGAIAAVHLPTRVAPHARAVPAISRANGTLCPSFLARQPSPVALPLRRQIRRGDAAGRRGDGGQGRGGR